MSKTAIAVAAVIILAVGTAAVVALVVTRVANDSKEYSIHNSMRKCEAATPYGFVNATTRVGLSGFAVGPARKCLYYSESTGVFSIPVDADRFAFRAVGLWHTGPLAPQPFWLAEIFDAEWWEPKQVDWEANCMTDSAAIANLIRGNPTRGGAAPPDPEPYDCDLEYDRLTLP